MASSELFPWDVIHREMIHVDLDELECLIFNHLDSLCIQQLPEVAELFARDTVAVLGALERLFEYGLDISESLYAVAHPEAEVAEPLVV